MSARTILVTGATAGIGRVTARELARSDVQLVLLGRSEERCRRTAEEIRRATGNERIEYLLADLSSLAQTRAAAEQFKARFERLDVLVNNVGALFLDFGETQEGFERTFALNHLSGYFLLTNELIDVLTASAPARIVTVASGAHRRAELDFDDLEMRRGYRAFTQYGNTKLMNILFTRELADRLAGTGVTANALHPGFVASSFGMTNNDGWWVRPVMKFMHLFALNEDEGARTSIYLASSPEVAGVTGRYFQQCRESMPSAAARDQASQRRLWEMSESLL